MFELIKNNRGLNTVDSLFNDFFSDSFFNTNSINTIDYYYSNDEKNHYIELALPGLDKKDINLNLNGSYLYLSYESKDESNSSLWSRSFNRRIKIPNNINTDSIKADLKNGILTIKIQKNKQEIENKKIEIK